MRPSHPADSAALACATASAVESAEIAATTGARPFKALDAVAQNRDLFIERKGGAFSERAERDYAGAAIFHEPAAMIGHESVIDFFVLIETSCDCGHYAIPLHRNPPFTFVAQRMRWNCRQARATHRKQRRADGINLPTEKKFSGGSANASLAWTHAAAGVQFGSAPGRVFAQAFVRDIFAAADQRVRAREILQLGTQRECVLQNAHNFLVARALRE